MYKYLKINNM